MNGFVFLAFRKRMMDCKCCVLCDCKNSDNIVIMQVFGARFQLRVELNSLILRNQSQSLSAVMMLINKKFLVCKSKLFYSLICHLTSVHQVIVCHTCIEMVPPTMNKLKNFFRCSRILKKENIRSPQIPITKSTFQPQTENRSSDTHKCSN